MYRKIIIFFLFYFAAVILNPVIAKAELGLEKTMLFCFVDDTLEIDENNDEFFKAKTNGSDHPIGAKPFLSSTLAPIDNIQFIGTQFLQRDWVTQSPLFLLFHSFLFYDIHF